MSVDVYAMFMKAVIIMDDDDDDAYGVDFITIQLGPCHCCLSIFI